MLSVWIRRVAGVAMGAALLLAPGLAVAHWWRTHNVGPVERGWRIASRHGCLSCHGSAGRSEDPHPAGTGGAPTFSREDVPDYARDEGELREWILDGKPQRLREEEGESPAGLLSMPAFGSDVSDEEIRLIGAYIAWLRQPSAAPGS